MPSTGNSLPRGRRFRVVCRALASESPLRGGFASPPLAGLVAPGVCALGGSFGPQDTSEKALGHCNVVVILFALCCISTAQADCFEHHGKRFGLDPALLRAIAHVESSGRPRAVNASHLERTGTKDLGLMQINSAWLPKLREYGITEADLFDGCTSVEVGAWVLHDLVRRLGNTWNAVGAYNASCSQLKGQACIEARARYSWRVYRRLQAVAPTSHALESTPQSPRTPEAGSPLPAAPGLISLAAVRQVGQGADL